jgi:hypothetical protein
MKLCFQRAGAAAHWGRARDQRCAQGPNQLNSPDGAGHSWQRCRVHWTRILLQHVPKALQSMVTNAQQRRAPRSAPDIEAHLDELAGSLFKNSP